MKTFFSLLNNYVASIQSILLKYGFCIILTGCVNIWIRYATFSVILSFMLKLNSTNLELLCSTCESCLKLRTSCDKACSQSFWNIYPALINCACFPGEFLLLPHIHCTVPTLPKKTKQKKNPTKKLFKSELCCAHVSELNAISSVNKCIFPTMKCMCCSGGMSLH